MRRFWFRGKGETERKRESVFVGEERKGEMVEKKTRETEKKGCFFFYRFAFLYQNENIEFSSSTIPFLSFLRFFERNGERRKQQ